MLVAELAADLKIDADDDSLGWHTMRRCFERAATQVTKDIGTTYTVSGHEEEDCAITPDPILRDKELLLIQAMIHLIGTGRLKASNAVSWKSGDKSVDRARTALSKTELVNDLQAQYERLAGLDEPEMIAGEIATPNGAQDFDFDRDEVVRP